MQIILGESRPSPSPFTQSPRLFNLLSTQSQEKTRELWAVLFNGVTHIKPSIWLGNKEVDAIERSINLLHTVIEMSRNFKSIVAINVEELLGVHKGDTEQVVIAINTWHWKGSVVSFPSQ